ncbi:MAG: hypothetical protein ACI8RZ_000492 [Myxococcota bacterium]|jgi:uncharacterized protein YkwD
MRTLPVLLLLLTGCVDEDASGPIPPDQRPELEDDSGFSPDDTDTLPEDTDTEQEEEEEEEADPIWEEDCHPDLEGWASGWASKEEKVVELINEARATPTNCGSEGNFAAAGPVVMDAHLRCAARYHSLWMSDTRSFSHESPGGDLGEDPWERIDSTGFAGFAVGENIAAGYGSASSVVNGWLDSDGHCSNLMNPDATLTGVGYYSGNGEYGEYWTQNFGQ